MDFADVSSLMENIIYLGLLYRISLYSSVFSSLLQVLKKCSSGDDYKLHL